MFGLQINIDNELTKGGFDEHTLLKIISNFKTLSSLKLRGLMAIPSPAENSELTRISFAKL